MMNQEVRRLNKALYNRLENTFIKLDFELLTPILNLFLKFGIIVKHYSVLFIYHQSNVTLRIVEA